MFQSPIVFLQSGHTNQELVNMVNEEFQSPIVFLQSGHACGGGSNNTATITRFNPLSYFYSRVIIAAIAANNYKKVSIPYRISTVGSYRGFL